MPKSSLKQIVRFYLTTTVTIINDKDDIEDLGDEGPNLAKIAEANIPHAMKAVAGLYQLFWNETHPDEEPFPPPTGLNASDGLYTDKIYISWNEVSGAYGYDVYRSTTNNSATASKIFYISSTGEDDTDVVSGQSYHYWVKAKKNVNGTILVSEFSVSDSGYAKGDDDNPPDTSITDGPSGTITYNNVTFIYTGSDNVTSTSNLVCSYKLDGYDTNWSSYTTSTLKSYSNLPNGSYTFYVKAKDEAGNVDLSPASSSFMVDQTTSCSYNISPTSKIFNFSGGADSVSVMAQIGCDWTATSNDSWITITSGSSGSGDGTVGYTVLSNSSTSSRTGALTIAGKTFLVTQEGTGISSDGLVAYYPFNGDANDSSGISEVMGLNNTEFVDNTLYLNGEYVYDTNGYRAIANISGFDYRAFSVSLDFYSMDFSKPNILTGGTSYRWFGLRYNNGNLQLTLNNQRYVHTFTNTSLEANNWHNVVCSFDLENKKIITMLDGEVLPEILLDSDFQLNIIGSGSEDFDKKFTFTNYSNGSVFYGYVDNLMIYNRALSEAEIQALYNYTPDPDGCYNNLPDPILILKGTEEYEADEQQWTRYLLSISNREAYPDELFELAPDLPPCGLNENASRTWVDIYTENGTRLYGFCGFSSSADLDNMWFAVPSGTKPSDGVYITITDRRCDVSYTSNLVFLKSTNVKGWRYTRSDRAGSCYYSWGSTELTENTLLEKFSISNAYGSLLTGDVTGNGHLEIIYVNGDQLEIYDGTGNLLHGVTLGSSNCSIGILEDINGDGVLDIGIGTGGTSNLKTYFYDGEGSLLKTLSKSAGYDCTMRPVGLLGNGDFVVSLNGGNSHSDMYRGFAVYDKGVDSEKWCYKVGPAFSITSIADFDGDGMLDLTNEARTVHNGCNADGYNNNGTMTTDDDMWLIIADEQGNEKFSKKYPSPSDGSSEHYFSDLNHDGVMEIVGFEGHYSTCYHGTSEIHLFDQSVEITDTFSGSEDARWSFTITDIDRDGKDEVIASC